MKEIICLFILAIVSLNISGQSSQGQDTKNDGFEKMSYEVELDKDHYLPFEPIFAKFSVSNKKGESIRAGIPDFLADSKLLVKSEGGVREFGRLTFSTGRPQQVPSGSSRNMVVVPRGDLYDNSQQVSRGLYNSVLGNKYEREELIEISSANIFQGQGDYQLQFVLYTPDRKKSIASNSINIKVEKPQGIDKEAFDFLSKYQDEMPFYWVWKEKDGISLLEMFVNKYSQSVYGESAIQYLGNLYLTKGELEKAQIEFEKNKFSNHKIVADEAKKSLSEIEKRKADLEKAEQQKQN